MKIKVKPEGRKGMYIPEKDSLKDFIKSKKFKQIHNLITGGMMIGADHSVDSVLEDIDKAERLAITIPPQMGHSLAIIRNNKLELYDIGELKEDNLEINK